MASPQLKDARFQYHAYLYQDPEFVDEINGLKEYIYGKYPEVINEGLFTEVSLKGLVTEADFQKVVSAATKFMTEVGMVSYFMCGYHEQHGINPKKLLTWPTRDGGVRVEFSPYITRDKYFAHWESVEGLKSGRGKRIRGPKNWLLIYAISKARRHGKTFKRIFYDYQDGTLENYDGPNSALTSEDALETYFRKYMYKP